MALLLTYAQAIPLATSFVKFNDLHNNIEHVQTQSNQGYQAAPVQYSSPSYQSAAVIAPHRYAATSQAQSGYQTQQIAYQAAPAVAYHAAPAASYQAAPTVAYQSAQAVGYQAAPASTYQAAPAAVYHAASAAPLLVKQENSEEYVSYFYHFTK